VTLGKSISTDQFNLQQEGYMYATVQEVEKTDDEVY
jgi:hypothetical protein